MYYVDGRLLLVLKAQMLYIDSLSPCNSTDFARLLEVLACAELAYGTGLFELALEFLKSALNVLTFFNWYDNHALNHPLFLIEGAKVVNYFNNATNSSTPSVATFRMCFILESKRGTSAGSTRYMGASGRAYLYRLAAG